MGDGNDIPPHLPGGPIVEKDNTGKSTSCLATSNCQQRGWYETQLPSRTPTLHDIPFAPSCQSKPSTSCMCSSISVPPILTTAPKTHRFLLRSNSTVSRRTYSSSVAHLPHVPNPVPTCHEAPPTAFDATEPRPPLFRRQAVRSHSGQRPPPTGLPTAIEPTAVVSPLVCLNLLLAAFDAARVSFRLDHFVPSPCFSLSSGRLRKNFLKRRAFELPGPGSSSIHGAPPPRKLVHHESP